MHIDMLFNITYTLKVHTQNNKQFIVRLMVVLWLIEVYVYIIARSTLSKINFRYGINLNMQIDILLHTIYNTGIIFCNTIMKFNVTYTLRAEVNGFTLAF